MIKLWEGYLHLLQEYEEVSYIETCVKYDCKESVIQCLEIARKLCRENKVCQHKIDRHIDAITGN